MTTTSKNTHSARSGQASSMAELMKAHKTTLKTFHKGDMIEGIITKLTPSEILVDVDAKTEAIVLEKEKPIVKIIMSTLKLGDKVTVQILNPESDNGNPVVSLRRYLDGKAWIELDRLQKEGQKLEVIVRAATKGGFLVDTPVGVSGFLPNSHMSHTADVSDMVGKKLTVMIAEQNPETRKLIVSQKQILGQKDFDDIIKNIKVGTKVDAIVSHITPFGIFVSIPTKDKKGEEIFLDGFVHISEISWERTGDLTEIFENGQSIEAVIIKTDAKTKRIDLSIKQLTTDPFEKISTSYPKDKKVSVTIEKVTESGIVVTFGEENELEGFIRKEKIPVGTTYKAGQSIECTVAEVDLKKHRIIFAPVLLSKPLMYR